MFLGRLGHDEREHVYGEVAARVLSFSSAGAAIELPAVSLVAPAS